MVRLIVFGITVGQSEQRLLIALPQDHARQLLLTGEHQSMTSRLQHLVALNVRTLKNGSNVGHASGVFRTVPHSRVCIHWCSNADKRADESEHAGTGVVSA
jgi:hypothetical protein